MKIIFQNSLAVDIYVIRAKYYKYNVDFQNKMCYYYYYFKLQNPHGAFKAELKHFLPVIYSSFANRFVLFKFYFVS